jgi:DGQHR domain-containing protein
MGSIANSHQFLAIAAKQSSHARVFTFASTAADIISTCEITRAGRTSKGKLFGFQRPQIAGHIQEIQDYIKSPRAVLPNSIVVGFFSGVRVKAVRGGLYEINVSTKGGKPGFVIDGQQRLTALLKSGRDDFQLFVSCVLCDSEKDLRQQFILINNTRPLPKSLIYELLPGVKEPPKRFGSRAFAASLTERLNYDESSSLKGMIAMHTNPDGVIRDTAIQKVIINSAEHGAIREHSNGTSRAEFGFELLSNYFGAVQDVFPDAWHDKTPHTSRLVHGAGIVSMGYVMETIYSRTSKPAYRTFVKALHPLRKHAAWTSGKWRFSDGVILNWDQIENTPRQIQKLAIHLVGIAKKQTSR